MTIEYYVRQNREGVTITSESIELSNGELKSIYTIKIEGKEIAKANTPRSAWKKAKDLIVKGKI